MPHLQACQVLSKAVPGVWPPSSRGPKLLSTVGGTVGAYQLSGPRVLRTCPAICILPQEPPPQTGWHRSPCLVLCTSRRTLRTLSVNSRSGDLGDGRLEAGFVTWVVDSVFVADVCWAVIKLGTTVVPHSCQCISYHMPIFTRLQDSPLQRKTWEAAKVVPSGGPWGISTKSRMLIG